MSVIHFGAAEWGALARVAIDCSDVGGVAAARYALDCASALAGLSACNAAEYRERYPNAEASEVTGASAIEILAWAVSFNTNREARDGARGIASLAFYNSAGDGSSARPLGIAEAARPFIVAALRDMGREDDADRMAKADLTDYGFTREGAACPQCGDSDRPCGCDIAAAAQASTEPAPPHECIAVDAPPPTPIPQLSPGTGDDDDIPLFT